MRGVVACARMRCGRARGIGWTIALIATLAGCASGPALRDGRYRDRERGWSIAAPPTPWRRVDAEGAVLAFQEPEGASMALAERCEGADAPLDRLARELRIGLGPSELVETQRLDLAGRPAELQVIALAQRRVRAVTRQAPPCVQDFVLVTADGADATRDFDAWWASFEERNP